MCWAAEWIDFDNDIDLDLYVATGINLYSNYPEILGNFPEINNSLYKNNGDSFFDDGTNMPQLTSHTFAVAQGDYNNDGYPDLVSHKLGEYAQFLKGTPTNNKWIKIKLKGTNSNSFGIGGEITLHCIDDQGNPLEIMDVVIAGENYLGQNSYWQNFGLKNISQVDSISVNWSGGLEEVFIGPFDSNQHITLTEGDDDSGEGNSDDEYGCTYLLACNYSSTAVIDDGSCAFSCLCADGTIWDEEIGNCVLENTCPSDIDNNGQTDVEDLLLLLIGFGSFCNE